MDTPKLNTPNLTPHSDKEEVGQDLVIGPGTKLGFPLADTIVTVDQILGGNGFPFTLVMFAPSRSNPYGFAMTLDQVQKYMRALPKITQPFQPADGNATDIPSTVNDTNPPANDK